jgi:hypothetical protein
VSNYPVGRSASMASETGSVCLSVEANRIMLEEYASIGTRRNPRKDSRGITSLRVSIDYRWRRGFEGGGLSSNSFDN